MSANARRKLKKPGTAKVVTGDHAKPEYVALFKSEETLTRVPIRPRSECHTLIEDLINHSRNSETTFP
jgi:hypothetical protein